MTVSKVLIIGKGFIGHHLANFLAGDPNFEVHAIANEQVNYRDNNILTDFIVLDKHPRHADQNTNPLKPQISFNLQ